MHNLCIEHMFARQAESRFPHLGPIWPVAFVGFGCFFGPAKCGIPCDAWKGNRQVFALDGQLHSDLCSRVPSKKPFLEGWNQTVKTLVWSHFSMLRKGIFPQYANTTFYFSSTTSPEVKGLVALTIDDGICRGRVSGSKYCENYFRT